MVELHGLDHPESRAKTEAANMEYFDPRIDRNMLRAPDRYIYVHSTSPREFRIDRAPLWSKLILRACPKSKRSVMCARIPDPLMQSVHNTENGRRRGEAHDGWRVAVDLLNPNNPTNDPDWNPAPEMAAAFSTSAGADLFAQGLFLSLNEEPTEEEVAKAERRREKRYLNLIAHADSLENTNRKELEEFLKGVDGTDLRMALDFYGEQRQYHKVMVPTRSCPNCGETIKAGVGFHKSDTLGAVCVLDWQLAVDAGVKNKNDVPDHLRWWDDKAEKTAPAKTAAKKAASRRAN